MFRVSIYNNDMNMGLRLIKLLTVPKTPLNTVQIISGSLGQKTKITLAWWRTCRKWQVSSMTIYLRVVGSLMVPA